MDFWKFDIWIDLGWTVSQAVDSFVEGLKILIHIFWYTHRPRYDAYQKSEVRSPIKIKWQINSALEIRFFVQLKTKCTVSWHAIVIMPCQCESINPLAFVL